MAASGHSCVEETSEHIEEPLYLSTVVCKLQLSQNVHLLSIAVLSVTRNLLANWVKHSCHIEVFRIHDSPDFTAKTVGVGFTDEKLGGAMSDSITSGISGWNHSRSWWGCLACYRAWRHGASLHCLPKNVHWPGRYLPDSSHRGHRGWCLSLGLRFVTIPNSSFINMAVSFATRGCAERHPLANEVRLAHRAPTQQPNTDTELPSYSIVNANLMCVLSIFNNYQIKIVLCCSCA